MLRTGPSSKGLFRALLGHNAPASLQYQRRFLSTSAVFANEAQPEPTTVRSFYEMPSPPRHPIVGNYFDFARRFGDESVFKISRDYYQEYGPIVRVTLFGDEQVWIADPRELVKVFRSEGKYPDGPTRITWPLYDYYKARKIPAPFLEVGEVWREHRQKMNKFIFNTTAANTYIPSLNETSKGLSKMLEKRKDDLMEFCNLSAFDLFCTGIIGKNLNVIDRETANPRDVEFAFAAARAFHLMGILINSPLEHILRKMNLNTKMWKEYVEVHDTQFRLARQIMDSVFDDPTIKSSYLKSLYENGLLTKEEARQEVVNLLGAAVDTTATTLMWFLYCLAQNPEKQRKAYEEVSRELKGEGFNKEAALPLLKACYKESLRFSPVGNGTLRSLPVDIELLGYNVPKGTQVVQTCVHLAMDPKYVDEPERYLPERWLDDAVEARKGTEKEVVDHPLLLANFGFGPRMCMGSRFAMNEMFSLTCQILQDWEISVRVPHDKVVLKLLRQPHIAPKVSLTPRR